MRFELQKKQMIGFEKCENSIGFKQIEILEFNYDGEGNALVLEDGDLSYYGADTLRFIMFSGWYKLRNKKQQTTVENNASRNLQKYEVTEESNYNLDENFELEDLSNTPMLEKLLCRYMEAEYKEEVCLSDLSIWGEYEYLLKRNELNKLFIQESLDNTYKRKKKK